MHSTFPKTIVAFLAFLAILVSIVCVHSAATHAAGNNTAEDNFQRPHTTVGWSTTTNKSGLINYPWQRSLGTSNHSYIQSSTGIIVYAGTNGHKIAGYVRVPAQLGGDALAQITLVCPCIGRFGCISIIDFIPIREWEAKDRVEDESYGRHNLFR